MKHILNFSIALIFAALVQTSFAQQGTEKPKKAVTTKAPAKKMQKKGNKGIENKIAVSDQAKPNDKKKGKTTGANSKSENGISNK